MSSFCGIRPPKFGAGGQDIIIIIMIMIGYLHKSYYRDELALFGTYILLSLFCIH